MSGNKLYCGCSGYNVQVFFLFISSYVRHAYFSYIIFWCKKMQEVDLSNYTSTTILSGTRKLLGKQFIHSLLIYDDFLIAGGSLVDSTAGKVIKHENISCREFHVDKGYLKAKAL